MVKFLITKIISSYKLLFVFILEKILKFSRFNIFVEVLKKKIILKTGTNCYYNCWYKYENMLFKSKKITFYYINEIFLLIQQLSVSLKIKNNDRKSQVKSMSFKITNNKVISENYGNYLLPRDLSSIINRIFLVLCTVSKCNSISLKQCRI